MINTQTFWGIKQITASMIDEIATSNLFNDALWAEVLNEALSYIYGYHKWSWNISDETIHIDNNNVIKTEYPIQEVILLTDWSSKYTQAEYYVDNNSQQFIFTWNTITLSSAITWDIRIVYRRWFNQYLPSDLTRKLDIPFWLNNPLISLMQFRILPIWLWEWSWWLMNNYLQDAIQQLERYKVMNTYAEARRNLVGNRK